MGDVELISCANDDELARSAAAAWLKEVESANRAGTAHRVALSGGRSARKFFMAVAERARAKGITPAAAHFFWADERCVPPDDPESNFDMARQFLFRPLKILDARIHRIRGESPPGRAAADAEADMCRNLPLNEGGQPVLDLVLLGMGEDGHVASLFPGEADALISSKSVYRAVVAAKPPPRRITLGYGAIAAARQVWVLVSGAGKETALRNSLRGDDLTPLARLLRLRGLTRVFSESDKPRRFCPAPQIDGRSALFSNALRPRGELPSRRPHIF